MLKQVSAGATVQSAFVSGSSHDALGAEVISAFSTTEDSSSSDGADLVNYGEDDVE